MFLRLEIACIDTCRTLWFTICSHYLVVRLKILSIISGSHYRATKSQTISQKHLKISSKISRFLSTARNSNSLHTFNSALNSHSFRVSLTHFLLSHSHFPLTHSFFAPPPNINFPISHLAINWHNLTQNCPYTHSKAKNKVESSDLI